MVHCAESAFSGEMLLKSWNNNRPALHDDPEHDVPNSEEHHGQR
jgi:hypothetical protein